MVTTIKHGDTIVGGDDVKIDAGDKVDLARIIRHQVEMAVHRAMGNRLP